LSAAVSEHPLQQEDLHVLQQEQQQQQQQQQGLVTKRQLLQFVVNRRWHESNPELDGFRRALALQLVRWGQQRHISTNFV
jgi:hypothetical protein